MNNLISIIVPVYNVEKYIQKCLDTISNQTFQDFEVILVDDGSTDASGVICDEFVKKDERFKVIHRENGGSSLAKNIGLNIAKGSYITFVDSDDWIRVDLLEQLLSLLKKNQTDISECCFFLHEDSQLKEKEEVCCYTKEEYMIGLLEEKFDSYFCGKLFKRGLFEEQFFPEGKSVEDMLIMPEIIKKASKIAVTNQEYYYYRSRPDSITEHPDYEMKNKTALAESYRLRYEIALNSYNKAEEIALKNAVTYSIYLCTVIGNLKIIDKKLRKEYVANYKFIKKYFSNIIKNKKVTIGYKLGAFVMLKCQKLFCTVAGAIMRIKNILRKIKILN